MSIPGDEFSKDPNKRALRQQQINRQNDIGKCFPAGTQIMTPSGARDIESLAENDFVTAWSESDSKFVTVRILKRVTHSTPSAIRKVYLKNGQLVESTPVHSLLTNRGWRKMKDLSVGMQLKTIDGWQEVDRTEEECIEPAVYNLITESCFTFVANGCVAHNFTYFKSLKVAFWTLISHWRKRKGLISSVEAGVAATSMPGR